MNPFNQQSNDPQRAPKNERLVGNEPTLITRYRNVIDAALPNLYREVVKQDVKATLGNEVAKFTLDTVSQNDDSIAPPKLTTNSEFNPSEIDSQDQFGLAS
jgi:hypothetical protein